MNTWRRTAWHFAVVTFTMWLVTPAFAQWAVEDTPAEQTRVIDGKVALVKSRSEHAFRIYVGENQQVWAELALAPGLARLAASNCPTYRIDGGRARAGTDEDARCDVGGRYVRFRVGQIEGERIRSKILLSFMNGSNLEMVFHLKALGYKNTRFSLRGSKQAIRTVLGKNTKVDGK